MTAYLASGVKFVGFLVDFPFILACKWVTFLPCTRNKLTEHRGDRMGESLDLLCLTEHRGEINKWFWNSVNVKMPCVLLRKKCFCVRFARKFRILQYLRFFVGWREGIIFQNLIRMCGFYKNPGNMDSGYPSWCPLDENNIMKNIE